MDQQQPSSGDRPSGGSGGSGGGVADAAYLGIDVGTTGVRAVLLDAAGWVLGRGARPLHSDRRNGVRHEQDPDEWWSALCGAVRQALTSQAGREGSRITAVAVAATSGTVVVEDDRGRPVTPGLLYDDRRALDLAGRVTAAGAAIWARSGVVAAPMWALPRVLWLVRNVGVPPGGRIAHQGDHLARRLTGTPVPTDTSQALKTGVDLVTGNWPADVFAELGLDPGLLPEVVTPGTLIGEVSRAAAAATGLPAGTQVQAGMTDGCAGQIGAGALAPGAWTSGLGTTLVLKGVCAVPLVDPSGACYAHRHPDGGWLPGGASNCGGGYLRQEFGPDLDALGAAAARDTGSSVSYPLLGTGERFPFPAPNARAFTLGEPGGRPARFAAALRGLACVERLAYDRVTGLGARVAGPLRFTGGATRNAHLTQLRADLLDRRVQVLQHGDAATGMAVLAAAPPGRLTETAARMVRPGREFFPDPRRHERLVEIYDRFTAELHRRGWLASGPADQAGRTGDRDDHRPAGPSVP